MGRENHEKRIAELVFADGKKYTWEDFSRWGEEIFRNGFVKDPPAGPSPSKPVSKYFKCATCHNDRREDPDLRFQDPEARFQWIEKTGSEIYLVQGTSMWGAVNRETYYSDYYEIYHHLCVPKSKDDTSVNCGPVLKICAPGCRTMKPDDLEDAIQVCSAYCSVGRYLAEWEMAAVLAFLWDREIRLEDLDLSGEETSAAAELARMSSRTSQNSNKLQQLLADKYAKKASNTYRGIPKVTQDKSQTELIATYPDKARFIGNQAMGERLYPLSCGRCHGTDNMAAKGRYLGGNVDTYYKMLAKGTRNRNRPYMPGFTLERLSRQQAADILEYLRGFVR
jgi:mono/diheme cytochrome c family protein